MPASLRGIDPPITAAQGTMIAGWAERIEATGTDNAWAIAINQFRQLYEPVGGRWQRKQTEADVVNPNVMAQTFVSIGEDSPSILDLVSAYQEAATIKARAQGLLRSLTSFLSQRDVPEALRAEVEDVQQALRRTWRDLADEATAGGADDVPDIGSTEEDTEEAGRDAAEDVPAKEAAGDEQDEASDTLREADMTEPTRASEARSEHKLDLEGVKLLEGEEGKVTAFAEATIAEVRAGHVVALAEGITEWDGKGPLKLTACLIQPGPGNERDGRYYPREVLERDAHVFEGGKMFPTDHLQEEKSAATEVADILKSPVGFTEEGGILAEIGIFDPAFARKAYNRAQLGMLHNLELSIIGAGETQRGEVGETEYDIVTSITQGSADFVTQAGAGGHAVAIGEIKTQEDAQPEDAGTEPEGEEAPNEAPDGQAAPEDAQEARAMTKDEVKGYLAEKAGVPEAVIARVAEREYETTEAIDEAVAAEVAYLKEVTGSGRPFGQDEGTPAGQAQPKKGRTMEEHCFSMMFLAGYP